MDDIFKTVKNAVSMGDVAKAYGYELNRSGFICCPFHSEKTASMKLYAHDFYCYGCDAHGDVIDFVEALFNLEPMAAIKRLNEDFNLGIDIDRPTDTEQIRKRKHLQDTRRRFDAWREQMLNQIDHVIRIANLADFHSITATESLAIQFREPMEAWGDALMHGSMDEQMQIFRDREEVGRICKTILNGMRKKSTAA